MPASRTDSPTTIRAARDVTSPRTRSTVAEAKKGEAPSNVRVPSRIPVPSTSAKGRNKGKGKGRDQETAGGGDPARYAEVKMFEISWMGATVRLPHIAPHEDQSSDCLAHFNTAARRMAYAFVTQTRVTTFPTLYKSGENGLDVEEGVYAAFRESVASGYLVYLLEGKDAIARGIRASLQSWILNHTAPDILTYLVPLVLTLGTKRRTVVRTGLSTYPWGISYRNRVAYGLEAQNVPRMYEMGVLLLLLLCLPSNSEPQHYGLRAKEEEEKKAQAKRLAEAKQREFYRRTGAWAQGEYEADATNRTHADAQPGQGDGEESEDPDQDDDVYSDSDLFAPDARDTAALVPASSRRKRCKARADLFEAQRRGLRYALRADEATKFAPVEVAKGVVGFMYAEAQRNHQKAVDSRGLPHLFEDALWVVDARALRSAEKPEGGRMLEAYRDELALASKAMQDVWWRVQRVAKKEASRQARRLSIILLKGR